MHIFRYGTNAEQKFIYNSSKTFDLLAINGNMLAHAPKAISSFIVKLRLKENGIGYFIDPITHSFQHDLFNIKSLSSKSNKYEIKTSIKKLIQCYGEPILSCTNNDRSVLSFDFDNLDVLNMFCKRVIDFQLSCIKDNIETSELDEYLSFENENYSTSDQYMPQYLIPPYFYLSSPEWLDVNVRFMQSAIQQFPDKKVYAQIVTPLDFLENIELQNELVKKYSTLKLSGVMLWIDQLSEHDLPYDKLKHFVEMLIRFRELKCPILNLYGSFFSILLTSDCFPGGRLLSGVGHGLEYGESRHVVFPLTRKGRKLLRLPDRRLTDIMSIA